jgi:MFS family permease
MFKKFFTLNILHILNDGFKASLLLFLPFIAQEFSISLTKVGFLGSTVNIFSVLLALPAGIVAAKIGGYKTLLWALFFYTIGYLLTSISPSFYIIVIAFMCAGIGFALFHPVAFALIAKSSDKNSRGQILGNFTAVGDIGRIGIAGIITLIITHIGWRYSAFGTFVVLLTVLYIALIKLKKLHNIRVDKKNINTTGYKEILKHKKFLLVSLTDLIDSFASQSLYIFIPFLLL